MKWTLRLLALTGVTVCGICFLLSAGLLLNNYNYEHHRFYPYVVEHGYITGTILWGLGLLCSVVLYFYLVQKMRPISK
jgi:hypothetical protein